MAPIHVIAKSDLSTHTVVDVVPDSAPLPEGSVRARSKILSITMTNKAYARLGDMLHWWNAYPVPSSAPAPYNNQKEWGIVPSWGYGEIIESKDENLPVGTVLYGQWATGAHLIEMKFKSGGKPGHFTEITDHRQGLMTVYNQFFVSSGNESEDFQGWMSSVMVIFSAGWLMTKFVFPRGDTKPIHPLGSGEWTTTDADLRSTVIISLAASSKTARGFAWGFTEREAGNSPLTVIEVGSNPDAVRPIQGKEFEGKSISYSDLTSNATIELITSLKPKRILVVDFGGRPPTVQKFHDKIISLSAAPEEFDYLMVGADPSWLETEDTRTRKTILNTSPLMDAAMAAEGAAAVEEDRIDAFARWLSTKNQGNLSLHWGSGIGGDEGIEGAWTKLMGDNLPGTKALVFRV